MELGPYITTLRQGLASAAAAGSEETRRTAELLSAALEPAARLAFMEMLSSAAAEITAALADATVEVRLRGQEPDIVVSGAPLESAGAPAAAAIDLDEGNLARITLRLPEALKSRVEQAASKEGLSANAWLVRAVASGLTNPTSPRIGRTVTGYVVG